MPRRIPDYPDAFIQWNLISSFGSIISTVSTIIFLYGLYLTLVQSSSPLINNYWYVPSFFCSTLSLYNSHTVVANTLEWTLPCPPSYHAFNHLPVQS